MSQLWQTCYLPGKGSSWGWGKKKKGSIWLHLQPNAEPKTLSWVPLGNYGAGELEEEGWGEGWGEEEVTRTRQTWQATKLGPFLGNE